MKTEIDMSPCKFKVGDQVIYRNLVANVDRISPVWNFKFWLLSLTSVEDEEMTCTAKESDCEIYAEINFDTDASNEALLTARLESKRVQNIAGNLTDKYFRDGNH